MPDRRFLLALVLLAGCYDGHVTPGEPDAAADASYGPDARDGAPGDAACVEGSACDDGDPCTVDDLCVSGVCAGAPLACESPPGLCFTAIGACVDGECVYEPDDGASCDDGDPCTSADRCTAGACAGEPLACDAPPPPVCLDETTLRTFVAPGMCGAGACTYAPRDRPCPDGCVDGACRCIDRPWELEVVPDVPLQQGTVGTRGIAVDAWGTVHIAFALQDDGVPSDSQIWYAQRPADGSWTSEPLGSSAFEPSLMLDRAGGAHILYAPRDVPVLRHAYRPRSGGWTTADIVPPPPTIGTGTFGISAIRIDDAGIIHAFLTTFLARAYATRAPDGTWTIIDEWEAEHGFVLQTAALDATGALSIIDGSNTDVDGDPARYSLRHRRRSPTGVWTESRVLTGPAPHRPQLVVGPSSLHLISTVRTTPGDRLELWHAWWTPGATAWNVEQVSAVGGVFTPSLSVDVDPFGRVHVTYSDYPRSLDAVGYAMRSPSGAWTLHPFDLPPDYTTTPHVTAVAADPDGGAHIAYSRGGEPLVHAHRRDCP